LELAAGGSFAVTGKPFKFCEWAFEFWELEFEFCELALLFLLAATAKLGAATTKMLNRTKDLSIVPHSPRGNRSGQLIGALCGDFRNAEPASTAEIADLLHYGIGAKFAR